MAVSYGYLFGLLFTAEALSRWAGTSAFLTRKAIHIAAGMWSVAALMLFTSWQWAIVAPLSFVAINYLSYRFHIFKAMESAERATLGTVFFPMSVALLLGLLWRPGSPDDLGYIAVGGLMAMTWGDSMAGLVGRRYGTRRLRFTGHPRTMEGTLAMFLASSATIAPTLAILGGMDWHRAVAFALIVGTVAASVEVVSVYGSDNLTVPLATAGTLYLLIQVS